MARKQATIQAVKFLYSPQPGLYGIFGENGASGARVLILSDRPELGERLLAKYLSARGLSVEIIDLSQMPAASGDVAFIRTKNQYVGAVYSSLFHKSINPAHSIYNALNRLYWLPKFGPPFVAFSNEEAVEKIDFKPPWLLATAWRLGLDGVVTSVEGAKSVVEHRNYMRNPLAKASVVMPKPKDVRKVFVTPEVDGAVGELVRWLGLKYAEVSLGIYDDGMYVIDVDPIPDLDENRAKLLAEVALDET
ncbi:MAG: hypothetical protein ABWJ97_04455 [Thermoproteus sp.]